MQPHYCSDLASGWPPAAKWLLFEVGKSRLKQIGCLQVSIVLPGLKACSFLTIITTQARLLAAAMVSFSADSRVSQF